MGTEFRLILLLIGLVIIAVVAWDSYRRIRQKRGYRLERDKRFKAEPSPGRSDNKQDKDLDQLGVGHVRRVQDRKEPEVEPVEAPIQQEVWFDDEAKTIEKPQKEEPVLSVEQPELVLVVNVMSREHKFAGSAILETLLPLGIRFGDMDIFHRYKNFSGDDHILFSIANATKPGSFDLSSMDTFESAGLSFFLVLPGPDKPSEALKTMMDCVEEVARSLNGKILDSNRSAWTKQTSQHYKEQVLEYERKTLAKRKSALAD